MPSIFCLLDGPRDLARELAAGVRVDRGNVHPVKNPIMRHLALLGNPQSVSSLSDALISDELVDYVEVSLGFSC